MIDTEQISALEQSIVQFSVAQVRFLKIGLPEVNFGQIRPSAFVRFVLDRLADTNTPSKRNAPLRSALVKLACEKSDSARNAFARRHPLNRDALKEPRLRLASVKSAPLKSVYSQLPLADRPRRDWSTWG